jgi:hypothetical protein
MKKMILASILLSFSFIAYSISTEKPVAQFSDYKRSKELDQAWQNNRVLSMLESIIKVLKEYESPLVNAIDINGSVYETSNLNNMKDIHLSVGMKEVLIINQELKLGTGFVDYVYWLDDPERIVEMIDQLELRVFEENHYSEDEKILLKEIASRLILHAESRNKGPTSKISLFKLTHNSISKRAIAKSPTSVISIYKAVKNGSRR